MMTFSQLFKALQQNLSSSNHSKPTPIGSIQGLRPYQDLRRVHDAQPPRVPSQTNVVSSIEANVMEPESSDGEDRFFNARERIVSTPDPADGTYESTFFDDALEVIEAEDDEESDAAQETTTERPFHAENGIEGPLADTIDLSSGTDSSSESDEPDDNYPDLFAATFGKSANKPRGGQDDEDSHDSDVNMLDESLRPSDPKPPPTQPPSNQTPEAESPDPFLRTLHAQGYDFLPCEHTPGCTCDPIQRLATPPLLSYPFRPASFPHLPDAVSEDLATQRRWHARARHHIPVLSARDTFDTGRRYWIAVLKQGLKPGKAADSRDWVWMKGNKFSTVATVFHHFQTTTMADPDDLVLLLGFKRPGMEEQMSGLDYFGDRLVVFRAVGKAHPAAKGRGLTEGLEKVVVELD